LNGIENVPTRFTRLMSVAVSGGARVQQWLLDGREKVMPARLLSGLLCLSGSETLRARGIGTSSSGAEINIFFFFFTLVYVLANCSVICRAGAKPRNGVVRALCHQPRRVVFIYCFLSVVFSFTTAAVLVHILSFPNNNVHTTVYLK